MPNIYADARIFPERNLFEDDFRQAFLQEYKKAGSSEYYDLWACRDGSATR